MRPSKQCRCRRLTIQENETKVELTLWREKTAEPINIGDFISVSQCCVRVAEEKKNLEHNQKYENHGSYEIYKYVRLFLKRIPSFRTAAENKSL